MLLILSQNQGEASTDNVIDWLDFFDYPFRRLNGVEFYKTVKVSISKEQSKIEIPEIDLDKINLVWFRRWLCHENRNDLLLTNNKGDILQNSLNNYITKELKCLLQYFFSFVPKEKKFSAMSVDEINKLMVLKKASELDIEIPETFILTKKRDFNSIRKDGLEVITKSIGNGITIKIEKEMFTAYTECVEELPETQKEGFAPSLFQENIKKKYEIRSFYLGGKFYSMAIFSQKDDQTKTDFRKYNHDYPNRVTPIKLPESLEKKLSALALEFGLNTGSFDLIKTMDNKYVLLEVNPGGQFEMVSYPCNYYLEKEIALELIKNAKKNEIRKNINQ